MANDTTRRCRNCARTTRAVNRQAYGVLSAINNTGSVNGVSGRYIFTPDQSGTCPPCDPIYRGPCPPNPDGTDLQYVYGYFTHTGILEANGPASEITGDDGVLYRRIDMNNTVLVSEEGIFRGRSAIIITDPGIYSITYSFRVPADTVIDTTIALLIGSAVVPGSAVEVVKSTTSSSMTVTTSAQIAVGDDAAEISLVTTNPLSIQPAGNTDIATLTVFSIA